MSKFTFLIQKYWIILIVLLLFLLFIADSLIFNKNKDFPFGGDFLRVETFGILDLNRWLDDDSLFFIDTTRSRTVANGVKAYEVSNPFIFLNNEQKGSKIATDFDGKRWYLLSSVKNGVYSSEKYATLEEMPTYAKINYENGDIEWFKNFSEMSEEDREIFESL